MACCAGSGCAGRGCAAGRGRGGPADAAGGPALEPTPAAHPGPEMPQAGVFLEPKRAACVPACNESCHLRLGVDGASPPPVTPSPRAFFRSQEAVTSSLAVSLTWGPWGLVGTWHERAEEPRAHESVFEAPVGHLSCQSSASVRPFVPADAVVVPALQVCPQRASEPEAPPGSVGSSRPSVAPRPPLLLREPVLPAPLRAPWGMCSEAQLFTSFLSTAAFPEPSSLTG